MTALVAGTSPTAIPGIGPFPAVPAPSRSRVPGWPGLSLGLLWLAVFLLPAAARGANPTYWGEVRAALRKNCTVCHNPRNLDEVEISGGLTLDNYAAVLKGKGKELVKPGRSSQSLLIEVLVTENTERRMPSGGKPLPPETIDLLERWIDAGAPEGVKPAEAPVTVASRPGRTRRRDILLATGLVIPKGASSGAAAGPLNLTLPVGPLAPVAAVTFSPDGKSLAVGTYGEVAIWDLTRGEPTRVLTNVLGAVHDLRYSPDGRLLAVAGGQPSAKGDLRLFQVGEWKLQAVLAGHEDTVASVAFRPDGGELASGSFDKTVRVWDVSSGKLRQTFTHHSDFVHAVAWTPDGKGLFSVSKDRSARLFDPRTGASRLTFSDRDQDALALAVSPDGKTLAVSGLEPGVSFWNTETGAKLRTGNGHRLGVYELAWSRDGSLLASAGADGTVKLWNEAGSAVRTLPAGSLVYAVALSPDGKLVASGSFDGLVRLFDTTTGRHLATLLALPPNKGTADWLALTPQGYSNGSPGLLDQGKWSAGGVAVSGEAVWKSLRNPDAVTRTLRREMLRDPVLGR